MDPTFIQQLGEIFPPPSQNTVGACDQITCLILYYISSRVVTLLKVTDAPLQVLYIFNLTINFKILNFGFQIDIVFVPVMSVSFSSHIFRLSTFLCLGSCTHCNFACFLSSKKCRHSSSNQGLCCFNSCRPRLSLAEVLIFSLIFSHALFMSPSLLMFPKAANLFVIST